MLPTCGIQIETDRADQGRRILCRSQREAQRSHASSHLSAGCRLLDSSGLHILSAAPLRWLPRSTKTLQDDAGA